MGDFATVRITVRVRLGSGLELGLGLVLGVGLGQKFANCARAISKLRSAFCNFLPVSPM